MKPYRLMMTHRSPFARRVSLALLRLEIPYEVEIAEPFHPTPEFIAANPLGLVPVLLRDDGPPLPDSGLILEFLEQSRDGVWPTSPDARIEAKRRSVLSCGIMAASVAWFLETQRTKPTQSEDWLQDHIDTITRCLETLGALGDWDQTGPQSQHDVCAAIEYLEFRLTQFNWTALAPKLAELLKQVRAQAIFAQTRPRMPS